MRVATVPPTSVSYGYLESIYSTRLFDEIVGKGEEYHSIASQGQSTTFWRIIHSIMPSLSNVSGPGFFYVLSAPKGTLSPEEYHDWYNYEHGPLRLKLDFIPNGYRYQGRDAAKGIWMACYDLDQVSGLEDPSYTNLRATRSQRETAIVERGLEYLDRRIYSLYSSRGSATDPSPVILAVTMRVKDPDTDEVDKWYEEVRSIKRLRVRGLRFDIF